MIICLMVVFLSLGVIVAPMELGYEMTAAAELGRVAGSLIAAIAVLCFWDVLAPLMWLCALGGLVLISSPLWLTPIHVSASIVHLISGLLITALGLVGRRHRQRYGGGWRSVFRDESNFTKITWS